ncbi:MAG: response regulator [Litorilinea sp.]
MSHASTEGRSRGTLQSTHTEETPHLLRALFLEDNEDDAELIAHELSQFGYTLEWLRVETEEEFVANLFKTWDIILTDFSLPQFDALTALRHVKRLHLDTPVIVVSGAIGEEQAVTAIHAGAVDYINKAYRGRLGAAVRNALSRRRMLRAQRDAQRQLARSEQQYRSLFEQNPDGVFALDPDGNFTEANASMLRLIGYSAAELPRIAFQSVVAPSHFEEVVQHFLGALSGKPQTYEIRGVRQDGSLFDARITNLPIVVDEDIVGVYGIAKDVTQRKQRAREQAAIVAIAEALRTSEDRTEILQAVLTILQHLFDDANVIFSRIDPDTHDIIVEEGVGKGKLWVGQKIPASRSGSDSLVRDGRPFIKRRGRDYAKTRVPSDEHVDWEKEPDFSTVGVPVRAQDEVLGAIWISRTDPFSEEDVELLTTISSMTGTALQRTQYAAQMQQLLRHSQEQARQMQQIVDTVPEAVLVLNTENRIILTNRQARDLLPLLGTAQLGDVLAGLGEHSCHDLMTQSARDGDWHTLTLPGGTVLEYATRSLHAAETPEQESATAQQPDSEFDTSLCLLVLRDVTEERRRQEAIQSQERLATVGQLAAGIAHDFNNILAVISLYSGSLLKNPDLPKRTHYLETISRQTQHAAELIAQILDFGRRSHIALTELNMSDFLLEMVGLLRRTLPENLEISVRISREELRVQADATRMQQVIMNLALNARDAMLTGGQLEFTLRDWHTDTEYEVPLDVEIPPGEWVVLTVRDTGTGIAQNHLPHIFEPFFTTKDMGKGTGLGLAQVYGIVKQHNGEIDVQSEPDMGTTFTIFLPLAKAQAPAVLPGQAAADPPAPEQQNVLLIEDNAEAMYAIYDILHDQLGYSVYCAVSGAEALYLYKEHAHHIDLILCDIVLPETDGIAIYHAIAAHQIPDTPDETGIRDDTNSAPRHAPRMILMSGYPLNEVGYDLVEQGRVGWIQKPFTPDELAAKIRSVFS